MALPTVAVVGRANVGKSTLVNRIVGRRAAIEHPEPGVTRDRQAYQVSWRGVPFRLVDTGGWEPRAKGLAAKILAQAERAAREADLILMVVDAEVGITGDDLIVARGLRRASVPVLLVANKIDSEHREREATGLERLGLGPPVPVSALHGRGSGDLLDLVVDHVRGLQPAEEADDAVPVAIVGRPNVGKSSLFNRLVGDERSIVHDLPGTTRDTVDTVAEIDGVRYRFIDTAGMRRRGAKDAEGPEYYGLVRSLRAIDEASAVIHVIDAAERATDQDQRIARRVADAGRAGIVVLNKWDVIDAEDVDRVAADTLAELRFVGWAPLVRTSALTGRGIRKMMPAVARALTSWEARIATAPLNSWIRDVEEAIPFGSTTRGRPTRIRYLTQARTRPPTFVVFATGAVTDAAQRALERRLRERFGFEGTPIKLTVRVPARRAR